MANIGDITINVGVTVDEETVSRCCNILSMYFSDNPDKDIHVSRWADKDRFRAIVSIGDRETVQADE